MSLEKKLAKYKINKAFTEGTVIHADLAPDVDFLVRLPSQYNRGYTAELYGDVNINLDDNGTVTGMVNAVKIHDTQLSAFMDHCLLKIDGEAVPDDFAEDYPELVDELFSKSSQLAAEIQSRVEEGAKKSSTSSNGKKSGKTKASSTSNLRIGAG